MTNPKLDSKLIKSPETTLARLRTLSYVLDRAIPIPGTKYRIGLDPILGLLPAAGDYVGTAISAYIIINASRLGASSGTLSRMVLNIILDTALGSVPVVGDLFDFAWKANDKNIALLEAHLNSPLKSKKADLWFVILLLGGLLVAVMAITAVGLWVLKLLFDAISS